MEKRSTGRSEMIPHSRASWHSARPRPNSTEQTQPAEEQQVGIQSARLPPPQRKNTGHGGRTNTEAAAATFEPPTGRARNCNARLLIKQSLLHTHTHTMHSHEPSAPTPAVIKTQSRAPLLSAYLLWEMKGSEEEQPKFPQHTSPRR